MMEISLGKQLESGIEIEVPQYYASNIKELDTYYGYLAWTMIFFKENQEERAMKILREIIRSNPERPEAYLML